MSIDAVHIVNPYSRGKRTKKQYLHLNFPQSRMGISDFTESFIKSIPLCAREALGYLAQLSSRFGFVCPSHFTIARKIGRCDRQVRRYLDMLKEKGFISSFQRYNDSCLYKVNPLILNQEVRQAFSRHTRSFQFIPFLLLLGLRDLEENVRLGLSNIYINKPLTYVNHIEGERDPQVYPMIPSQISQTLRSLHCFKLTRWGQMRLCCYPDEALLYAQKQLVTSKGKVHDLFVWFKSVCERYCFEKGLRIRHDHVTELHKQFPEPPSARMLLDEVQSAHPREQFCRALESAQQDPSLKWLFGSAPMTSLPQSSLELPKLPQEIAERIAARKRARGIQFK